MTDPIADMLTRIRNAYLAKKPKVVVPYSKLKANIAEKLMSLGYIESYEEASESGRKSLLLTLKYKNRLPIITNIKRVSTPGRRLYVTVDNIPRILSGYGHSILSTSSGLLTDAEARKKGIGGELLFQIS